jgi:hypothetical protein
VLQYGHGYAFAQGRLKYERQRLLLNELGVQVVEMTGSKAHGAGSIPSLDTWVFFFSEPEGTVSFVKN